MAKPGFERRTVHLTQEAFCKAQSLVASGQIRGRTVEWADDKVEGLCLRLSTRACGFYLRPRTRSLKMAEASSLTVEHARLLAANAKMTSRHGVDPRLFIDVVLQLRTEGKDLDTAIGEAVFLPNDAEAKEASLARIGSWTWREMTAAFHAHKAPGLKGRWKTQYPKYLRDPAFDPIADMYVSDVKIRELEQVRERLLESAQPSRILRSLSQMKEMMSWAWSERAAPSGLADT